MTAKKLRGIIKAPKTKMTLKEKAKVIGGVRITCFVVVFLVCLVSFLTPNKTIAATAGPVQHGIEFDLHAPNFNNSTLDASPRRARVDTVITYTMIVRNSGNVSATGTRAICPIPEHTSYVTGSITGIGKDDSNPNVMAWNIGTLAAGNSITLTFKALIDKDTPDGTTIYAQGTIFCNELYPTLTSDPDNPIPFSKTTVLVYHAGGPAGPTETGVSILQALLIIFASIGIARYFSKRRQPRLKPTRKSMPAVNYYSN